MRMREKAEVDLATNLAAARKKGQEKARQQILQAQQQAEQAQRALLESEATRRALEAEVRRLGQQQS
jgi:hypothetical protein